MVASSFRLLSYLISVSWNLNVQLHYLKDIHKNSKFPFLSSKQICTRRLEGDQNKNNCLVINFYDKLKSPTLFPTCFARREVRKVREIPICCINCSQGSCSNFDCPLIQLDCCNSDHRGVGLNLVLLTLKLCPLAICMKVLSHEVLIWWQLKYDL